MVLKWEQVESDKTTDGLGWVSRAASFEMDADDPLAVLLAENIEFWHKKTLEELTRPSPFLQLFTKRRYMEWSKPRPHEFGEADGRAIMRRLRKGRPVSPALITKAVEAITDAAERDYY